ncbi:hypothetical protein SISNIDRAFT_459016 [Sistotremastrum niveocremeum HHB9708]|uniref:Uncharacterized protein n=1 Tax=Sistotremastrum niveocremeum HHB9708 TaxID=1314777 RepID=A0A164Q2Y5_9AGAM|nr:hypothetical protein SISNIDRAFT_459016 [Sistotremastrum niveocremeum HHB9708]
MPPRIEWPTEKTLRATFAGYATRGITDREEQIDLFLQDYGHLSASRRSVLDLIRSLESGNGRVLETIRGRDEKLGRTNAASGSGSSRKARSSPNTNTTERHIRGRRGGAGEPVTDEEEEDEDDEIEDEDEEEEKTGGDGRVDGPSSASSNRVAKKESEKDVSRDRDGEKLHREKERRQEAEIERLRAKVDDLRKSLEDTEKNSEDRKIQHYKDIQTWSDKNLVLEQEISMLTEEVSQTKTQLEEIRGHHQRHEKELARAFEDILFWRNTASTKDEELSQLRQSERKAQIDLERLRSECDMYRRLIEERNDTSAKYSRVLQLLESLGRPIGTADVLPAAAPDLSVTAASHTLSRFDSFMPVEQASSTNHAVIQSPASPNATSRLLRHSSPHHPEDAGGSRKRPRAS